MPDVYGIIKAQHDKAVRRRAYDIARMETHGAPKTSIAGRAKQRLAEKHFAEFMDLVEEEIRNG